MKGSVAGVTARVELEPVLSPQQELHDVEERFVRLREKAGRKQGREGKREEKTIEKRNYQTGLTHHCAHTWAALVGG
jgi:hypothetical protein